VIQCVTRTNAACGEARISEQGFVRHVGSHSMSATELAHPVATPHTNFAPPATQIDNTATFGVC